MVFFEREGCSNPTGRHFEAAVTVSGQLASVVVLHTALKPLQGDTLVAISLSLLHPILLFLQWIYGGTWRLFFV